MARPDLGPVLHVKTIGSRGPDQSAREQKGSKKGHPQASYVSD